MAVRVGVIGAGVMGADHARILHRFVSGASVSAVADVDLGRARAVVTTVPSAIAISDAMALIEDSTVDAVLVASHDSTHTTLINACVAAGKPVLCEKPLAPSLVEGANLIRAIGAEGEQLVSLGFMRRFDPGYVELKSSTHHGDLGKPLVLHCISRGVSSGPGATSASSVTGSSIHDFDVVPWLLGSPVVEVAWFAPRQSGNTTELQDPQVILLRTADGVLTTIETYLNARYGYDVRCEVVGEIGVASLAEPVRTVADRQLTRSQTYAADWRPRFAEAYRLELQAWVDALNAGTPSPLATARDGLAASAVADAVITSMHGGGGFVPVPNPVPTGN